MDLIGLSKTVIIIEENSKLIEIKLCKDKLKMLEKSRSFVNGIQIEDINIDFKQ